MKVLDIINLIKKVPTEWEVKVDGKRARFGMIDLKNKEVCILTMEEKENERNAKFTGCK